MNIVVVKHRNGWCATDLERIPSEDDTPTNQRTRCEHTVVLPFDYRRGQPTCPECRALVERRRKARSRSR